MNMPKNPAKSPVQLPSCEAAIDTLDSLENTHDLGGEMMAPSAGLFNEAENRLPENQLFGNNSQHPLLVPEVPFTSELEAQEAKNRRRHNRRTVVWKATIQVGAHKLPCWVRNISPFGALMQIDLPLAQSSSIVMELDKIGPVAGFVAWSNGTLHGIAFMESPDVVAQRFGTEADRLGFFRKIDPVELSLNTGDGD
jgi:hypothetical protein